MTHDGSRDSSVRHDTRPECPLPDIPRDQWRSHPNYPSQALLLGSHKNFRRISQLLIDQAQAMSEDSDTPLLYRAYEQHALYLRWIMAMRSHERYEESKLYPYLTHRYGLSTRLLEEAHEALHTLDEAVRGAYAALSKSPDPNRSIEALVEALKAHDSALNEHLIDEEDAVIPLLLSLPREEFDLYYRSHINALLETSQQCAC